MRIGPTGHAYFEPTIESDHCRRKSSAGLNVTDRRESETKGLLLPAQIAKQPRKPGARASLTGIHDRIHKERIRNTNENDLHQRKMNTTHSKNRSFDSECSTQPPQEELYPIGPYESPVVGSNCVPILNAHQEFSDAREQKLVRMHTMNNTDESYAISGDESDGLQVRQSQRRSVDRVDSVEDILQAETQDINAGSLSTVPQYEGCYSDTEKETEDSYSVKPLMSPIQLPIWDALFVRSEDEDNSAQESDPRPADKTNADMTDVQIPCNEGPGYRSDEDNRIRITVGARPRRGSKSLQGSCSMTPEQLAFLNLRWGVNEAVFSVVTKYQGTCQCASFIYLWNWDEKIVISDIDGTITKSDWLGHLMPIVGFQWIHSNVAPVYYRIAQNGYRFVYLSSRPIGQSRATRGFLNTVRDRNCPLPDGPILLAPFSLIKAFQKEVIQKKAEEFKIECLRQVRDLFPLVEDQTHGTTALVAGFGNRPSDVLTYKAVGLRGSQIFTVNHRSEIVCDIDNTRTKDLDERKTTALTPCSKMSLTFESLLQNVDVYFPRARERLMYATEHSDFTYWRT
ncbi:unnamed protein product [Dicrocoelium dendriticum]|nr:unnamed protein product [Dicrocoelium dendriticum]